MMSISSNLNINIKTSLDRGYVRKSEAVCFQLQELRRFDFTSLVDVQVLAGDYLKNEKKTKLVYF